MIRNTLLIIPLLLVVTLYFLREGVTIDSLKIGRFQVEGLYLKLDKKLVANITYFQMPVHNQTMDIATIEKQIKRLNLLSKYFTKISLDDVMIDGKHYRVIYRDDVFYLSGDLYEVAGTVVPRKGWIEGVIPYLYLKKQNLRWKGQYRYHYRHDVLDANGTFDYQGIRGAIEARRDDKGIGFHLSIEPFGRVNPLLDLVHANPKVREWVGKRVQARRYRITTLDGVLTQDTNGTYRLKPLQLQGKGRMEGVTARFKDGLKPLKADAVDVTLKGNVLYGVLTRPTYAKRSLAGSTLYLTNLIGTKARKLHLELKARTPYDQTVARILKAYGIKLPFLQTDGETAIQTTIDTTLGVKKSTKISGTARLKKGGKATFFKTPLTLRGGEVAFDNTQVTLHGVDVDVGWLRTALSGTYKYHTKSMKLTADLRTLTLGKKSDPFLHMRHKNKIPIRVNWKKKTTIDLPLYKTKIVLNKPKGFTLTSGDIRPIQPYLKGLPVPIRGGSVTVKTRDNKHYTFFGKTTWPTSYLYDKKGSITQYPFSGTYNGKSVSLKLLGGRIVYDGGNNLVKLDHLYIDGKKLMDQNKKGSSASSRIHVKGTNTLIRYEKYVLLTDRFDLRVHGKSTKFVATKDGDTVRVDLNGNALVVKAHRIKAPMLRALINFGGLSGGHYSLDLRGNLKGTLRGVITIDGGTVSRFKTYNNMIALFNTVPALASLKDPGFSKDGFEVKEGRIEFRVVKNRVYFDMIYVDGKSASISGKGTVSTINGAINMDLAVRTARGIGKLIGSLPIVGYILMGKDKSITTGVKVTGTLENPKVTTNVVMETLLAPFEMMVRTLKSPAHIINQ